MSGDGGAEAPPDGFCKKCFHISQSGESFGRLRCRSRLAGGENRSGRVKEYLHNLCKYEQDGTGGVSPISPDSFLDETQSSARSSGLSILTICERLVSVAHKTVGPSIIKPAAGNWSA